MEQAIDLLRRLLNTLAGQSSLEDTQARAPGCCIGGPEAPSRAKNKGRRAKLTRLCGKQIDYGLNTEKQLEVPTFLVQRPCSWINLKMQWRLPLGWVAWPTLPPQRRAVRPNPPPLYELSWNCRGTKRGAFTAQCRLLLNSHNPSICCFLETKADSSRLGVFRTILDSDWGISSIPALVGRHCYGGRIRLASMQYG